VLSNKPSAIQDLPRTLLSSLVLLSFTNLTYPSTRHCVDIHIEALCSLVVLAARHGQYIDQLSSWKS
jgi:hypothetical protein